MYRGADRPTPLELAITADLIPTIDLGKYKCVACLYRSATAAGYRSVATSRAEVERLTRDASPAAIVIEACSLVGWVRDLCCELVSRAR